MTSTILRHLQRRCYNNSNLFPKKRSIAAIRYFATASASPSERNGVLKSDYGLVSLPNQDVCSFLFPRWEKFSDKEAFECLQTGQKLTYGQLLDASLRWGGAIKRLVSNTHQSSESPTVAIFAPNVIEYGPVLFGTLAAGWSFLTINSNYKIGEIIHSLRTNEPQILVVDLTLEDLTDEVLKKMEISIPVVTIGLSKRGKPNLQELLKDPKAERTDVKQVNAKETAIILQSGGTTGLPKSVALPHKSLTNNLAMFTDQRLYAYGGEDYPHQTVIGLIPFYHSYGLYVTICTNMYLGSKILVVRNFIPQEFGNIIKDHKIKFLHLVPTLMNFVVNSPLVTSDQLSSIRGTMIASAPVSPSMANAFRQKSSNDVIFQEGYGMTELCGATLTPKDSVRIGFCGKLLPNMEAKIVDLETGMALGPEQRGEILLRGPSTMSHYIKNPTATAETLDAEGWFHTGDVATYTKDGFFSIVDRIKELIKVKEFQVSPAEIEDVLMEHSSVAEAGVVGVPNDRMGECPRAYVTLKGKATEEELQRFIEERLSRPKWLTGGVRFLEEIPKNPAGKLLRKELKQLMLEELNKK